MYLPPSIHSASLLIYVLVCYINKPGRNRGTLLRFGCLSYRYQNLDACLEEWTRGLVALRADTLDNLKKALPELEKEVRSPSNFADFYAYAFTYSLTEEKQGIVDIETICQLLDMVMRSTFRPQVDYFVEFLKIQDDYKVINMDQWMSFYRFCNELSFPEMTEYNPELAWPLLLNNFVEWIREKKA
ncbi:uncharacterized protein LOC130507067 isoform X2 [Raphanus sativus]|uniref:Defective in cullin neddylation protein n=1 Tax=Raphanus sativus TaxID=3726 RepID=A0A9W3D1P4_RAPSA|nr:uncharacterized protein LOC130506982 isoform X2 [Raphanus sativus]XP_056857759.1 uncharacterized protein LOC130507067 isoform X2 [Raphanus sativus]